MDFEIYEVSEVTGHGVGSESEQQFLPFYSADSAADPRRHSAYFTARREPRLLSPTQKRRGPRSSYIGTEVFISLVDPAQAPFSGDLRQLSVQTLCTNRDLVLQMPMGLGATDFTLNIAAPVTANPRDQRSQPAEFAAGGRRRVLARHQPPVAQLPVAGELDPAGGRHGAAQPARAVRAGRGRERQEADRRRQVGWMCARSCGDCLCRGRSPSAAASRSR